MRIFGGMSREADSVGTRGIRDGEDVGRFGVSRFAAVVPINVRSRKRAGVRLLMALYSWRPGRQGCFFASMDFSFLVSRSERHGSAVGNGRGVFPAGTRRRNEEFYLCRGACSAIRSDPAVEPCAADEAVRCCEGVFGATNDGSAVRMRTTGNRMLLFTQGISADDDGIANPGADGIFRLWNRGRGSNEAVRRCVSSWRIARSGKVISGWRRERKRLSKRIRQPLVGRMRGG